MALITYLTKIQFDFGALALLPEELAALGIARPLVATKDHCAETNPRAASAADYEALFREAMG